MPRAQLVRPPRIAVVNARRLLWAVTWVGFLAAAVSVVRAQTRPADGAPPSPLEQALIDHTCRPKGGVPPPPDDPVHQTCLSTQLEDLRATFGRDLKRLTGGDRAKVDARCTPLQTSRGPDAYVACLSGELAALRTRRKKAGAPARADVPPSVTGVAPPAAEVPLAPVEPVAPGGPTEPSEPSGALSSSATGRWRIVAAVIAGLAVVGWLAITRRRTSTAQCHECGATLLERGTLCAACRHQLAESRRLAAAESTSDARTVESAGASAVVTALHAEGHRSSAPLSPAPLPSPVVDESRAQEEERARLQAEEAHAEQARRSEESRRAEERRKRQEEIYQLSTAHDAPADVFDPYLVLGIARTASPHEIQSAYEAAVQKYSPDEVAHLGAELRDHFKAKAQAVDRAYRLLATSRTTPIAVA